MKTLKNFVQCFQVTDYMASEEAKEEKKYILESMGYSPKKFNIRINSDRVDNDSRVFSIMILPKVLKD